MSATDSPALAPGCDPAVVPGSVGLCGLDAATWPYRMDPVTWRKQAANVEARPPETYGDLLDVIGLNDIEDVCVVCLPACRGECGARGGAA